MSDEPKPQSQTLPKPQEKREDKRPSTGPGQGGQGGNRNRRNPSRSGNPNGGNPGGPRPASRGSNKRGPTSNTNPTESGSESAAKKNDGKKNDHRSRPSTGGPRTGGNRRPSQSANQASRQNSGNSNNNGPKQNGKQPASASPIPVATSDSSVALSSLQRVIADLKTTPPASQPSNSAPGITASISMPSSQIQGSNLPPNAPVFQPGAAAYPGNAGNEPPRHRKAASLGTGQGPALNTYSPNLGSMMEVVEDQVNVSVEEGEIRENIAPPAPHQRRSLSQTFTAPRFAALAAQNEQGEGISPVGRPQLAPGFMFGGRRRPSAAMPLGPPINEEDIGFQFPQQQNQPSFSNDSDPGLRKPDQGENDMTGLSSEKL